jgi:hypothetical protein
MEIGQERDTIMTSDERALLLKEIGLNSLSAVLSVLSALEKSIQVGEFSQCLPQVEMRLRQFLMATHGNEADLYYPASLWLLESHPDARISQVGRRLKADYAPSIPNDEQLRLIKALCDSPLLDEKPRYAGVKKQLRERIAQMLPPIPADNAAPPSNRPATTRDTTTAPDRPSQASAGKWWQFWK